MSRFLATRPLLGIGAACAAVLFASTAAESASYPAGQVIVRDQCFGGAVADGLTSGAVFSRGKMKSSSGGAGSTRSSAQMAPPPPPSVAAPSAAAPVGGLLYAEPEPEEMAFGDLEAASEASDDRWAVQQPAKDLGTEADIERPPIGPRADWGATVYLSNDDSMSLASAQRLLWAVERGARWTVDQVRPHELLNYFSFDTKPTRGTADFSVHASAVPNGDDGLSVALAVQGASPAPRPLDLTMVVDRSCSMDDEGRMDYTKRGMKLMADRLNDGDRVDVVLFDDTVCTPLENFVVGRDDPALLRRVIDRMTPEGSTDLDRGLREGYRIATGRSGRDAHGRNQRVMLVTDALLNTGNVDTDLVSEVGRAFDDDGIRLTGIGVGTDFNDEMLDKLTEKGKGAYVFLGSEAVVDRVFGLGFPSLTQTLAHDVHFALHLPDSLAMERFYGEESSTNKADIQAIHYYAGTSQVFLQDLIARGARDSDPIELEITYREADTDEPARQLVKMTVGELLAADPHNVHKARALMAWSDALAIGAMGGDACGEPVSDFRAASRYLADDAEIAYVGGLLGRQCGLDMSVQLAPSVAYKVRVDSDVPIAEVGLQCGGQRWAESLSMGDQVARFDAAEPGQCTLTLQGIVDMKTTVSVPETGGQARCLVRGGRLQCT